MMDRHDFIEVVIDSRVWSECGKCGAIVRDTDKHFEWHETQLPHVGKG